MGALWVCECRCVGTCLCVSHGVVVCGCVFVPASRWSPQPTPPNNTNTTTLTIHHTVNTTHNTKPFHIPPHPSLPVLFSVYAMSCQGTCRRARSFMSTPAPPLALANTLASSHCLKSLNSVMARSALSQHSNIHHINTGQSSFRSLPIAS